MVLYLVIERRDIVKEASGELSFPNPHEDLRKTFDKIAVIIQKEREEEIGELVTEILDISENERRDNLLKLINYADLEIKQLLILWKEVASHDIIQFEKNLFVVNLYNLFQPGEITDNLYSSVPISFVDSQIEAKFGGVDISDFNSNEGQMKLLAFALANKDAFNRKRSEKRLSKSI